jgi:hypothetical protein
MSCPINPLLRPTGSHSSRDCGVAPLGRGAAITYGLHLALTV